MENKAQHRKKDLISKQVKYMIAAASVAGTVGLWGIFSKADAQTSNVQSSDALAPTLATLVALNPSTDVNSSSSVVAADNSLSALPVVTQAPAVSSSNGQANVYQAPVPMTRTRTSR